MIREVQRQIPTICKTHLGFFVSTLSANGEGKAPDQSGLFLIASGVAQAQARNPLMHEGVESNSYAELSKN